MRSFIQLALCTLVSLAASPVALSFPLMDISDGAVYGRDPQGDVTSGTTFVAPITASVDPTETTVSPTATFVVPITTSSETVAVPSATVVVPVKRDGQVPPIARQVHVDGGILIPVNN